jgi:hypothetical protein
MTVYFYQLYTWRCENPAIIKRIRATIRKQRLNNCIRKRRVDSHRAFHNHQKCPLNPKRCKNN